MLKYNWSGDILVPNATIWVKEEKNSWNKILKMFENTAKFIHIVGQFFCDIQPPSIPAQTDKWTRKHSSRMCTARLPTVSRCTPCLGGVGVDIPTPEVPCLVCVCGEGGTHHTRSHPTPKKGHATRVPTLPSWTDRHLWKHYLPATSLAGGNNSAFIRYTRRFPCLVILLLNSTVTLIEINRAMADATDHWKKFVNPCTC